MRKVIDIIPPDGRVKLHEYDLFMPNIIKTWIIDDEEKLLNHYKYNPETGKAIVKEDLETWYPVHGCGVQLIEKGQGWEKWSSQNILKLFRSGSKLLIEYRHMKCGNCSNLKIGGFDIPYCFVTGCTKSKSSTCDESEKNVFLTGNVYGKVKNRNPQKTDESLNSEENIEGCGDKTMGAEIEATTEIAELCPYCQLEISLKWDVSVNGYETICPECGKELMLCSECINNGDYCDWSSKNGCYRNKTE